MSGDNAPAPAGFDPVPLARHLLRSVRAGALATIDRETGGPFALACVPVLVFSAPFIILRNTLRGRRFERRPMGFVFAATLVACFWSLMSGRLVLDLAHLITGA